MSTKPKTVQLMTPLSLHKPHIADKNYQIN